MKKKQKKQLLILIGLSFLFLSIVAVQSNFIENVSLGDNTPQDVVIPEGSSEIELGDQTDTDVVIPDFINASEED